VKKNAAAELVALLPLLTSLKAVLNITNYDRKNKMQLIISKILVY
jgi:hypothetical protein